MKRSAMRGLSVLLVVLLLCTVGLLLVRKDDGGEASKVSPLSVGAGITEPAIGTKPEGEATADVLPDAVAMPSSSGATIAFGEVAMVDSYRPVRIRGRVVDSAGAGVPGAAVALWRLTEWERETTRSDGDGRFVFDRVYSEDGAIVKLMAASETLRSAWTDTMAIESAVGREIVLTVDRAVMGIGGTVTMADGTALANVEVTASDGDALFSRWSALSDDRGRFLIAMDKAGRYELETSVPYTIATGPAPDDWATPAPTVAPAWIDVWDGTVTDGVRVVFDGTLGETLTVRVATSGGKAIAGAFVSVSADEYGSFGYGETDAAGMFTFRSVAPDAVMEVSARHDDYGEAKRIDVRVGDGPVDVVFEALGTVAGRVVDGDGQPVPAFEVAVAEYGYDIEGMEAFWSGNDFTALRDPEGRFQLEGIERTECTLAVRAEGYATATVPLESGSDLSDITVTLEAEGVIAGRVLTPGGLGAVGARVYVFNGSDSEFSPSASDTASATADSEGYFQVAHLGLREYTVVAGATAHGPVSASVDLSNNGRAEVTLQLRAGGSIRGTVLRDGVPHETNVSLDTQFGNARENALAVEGRFAFTGLAAGRYMLFAANEGGEPRFLEVEVAEGEERNIVLDVSSGAASLEGIVTNGGVPVVGGQIECYYFSESAVSYGVATIREDGSYFLGDLFPCVCALQVSYDAADGSSGNPGPAYRVAVAAGEAKRFDIDAAEVGGIQVQADRFDPDGIYVTLAADDVPVGDANASILGYAYSTGIGRDDSGQLVRTNIVPGRYHVILVRQEDDAVLSVVAVEVRAGELAEVTF